MSDEIFVTSYFSLMLLAIEEHIKNTVPEIVWVDQDLGQLEEDTERPMVQWPCCLIDFGNTNYDQQGKGVQMGNQTIQLRIGFNPFSSAASATPIKYRQKALDYYEIEQKVYQAFQGWTGNDLCQPLTRTNVVTEKRDDSYRVRMMLFTTIFDDYAATTEFIKKKPKLVTEII